MQLRGSRLFVERWSTLIGKSKPYGEPQRFLEGGKG